MTPDSTAARSAPSPALPLGPAVARPQPRTGVPAPGSPGVLPPFTVRAGRSSAAPQAGASAEQAPAGSDSQPAAVLPVTEEATGPQVEAAPAPAWLSVIDTGAVAPPEQAGEPADRADTEPDADSRWSTEPETDLPSWMAWVGGPEDEQPQPSQPPEDPEDVEDIRSLVYGSATPPEALEPIAGEPLPTSPGAPLPAPGASSGAVAEVADRLEKIAASLRNRPLQELLTDARAGDPLELLLTGIVIGRLSAETSAPPGGG